MYTFSYRLMAFLMGLGLFLFCPPSQVWGQKPKRSIPRIEYAKKSLFQIPKERIHQFGYLLVPEDRTRADSKIIRLPFFHFKSRSSQPAPDPIIMTLGGPGTSSMQLARYTNYYSYLDDRDLIIFEQRGTQYAQPSLNCPELAKAIQLGISQNLKDTELIEKKRIASQKCQDKLRKKGIQLNAYHTEAIAADMEDLRKLLGIESYNFYGLSYSTKIAQVLMRDYPAAIRSVVMDSPLPLESHYDAENTRNLWEASIALLQDCAEDTLCNTTFPELKSRFLEFMEAANKQALSLSVKQPKSGEEVTYQLGAYEMLALIYPSNTYEIPDMPWRLEQVMGGDYAYLKEQIKSFAEGTPQGIGLGMRLSVWCSEELPFVTDSLLESQQSLAGALKETSPLLYEQAICDVWQVKVRPAQEDKAVLSKLPVLLISGAFDPDTPPRWAANMLSNLPHAFHLVFQGYHHTPSTFWDNPCGMHTVQAFFQNPHQMPALDCFEQIKKPSYRLE